MVGTTKTNTAKLSYETAPVPIIDPGQDDITEKRQAVQLPDLPIFLSQLIQIDQLEQQRAERRIEGLLRRWKDDTTKGQQL